jgi:hypothetical protein
MNYYSMTEKWTLEKSMAMCLQEEERDNNKKLERGKGQLCQATEEALCLTTSPQETIQCAKEH